MAQVYSQMYLETGAKLGDIYPIWRKKLVCTELVLFSMAYTIPMLHSCPYIGEQPMEKAHRRVERTWTVICHHQCKLDLHYVKTKHARQRGATWPALHTIRFMGGRELGANCVKPTVTAS